jgi:hypothetical protein
MNQNQWNYKFQNWQQRQTVGRGERNALPEFSGASLCDGLWHTDEL